MEVGQSMETQGRNSKMITTGNSWGTSFRGYTYLLLSGQGEELILVHIPEGGAGLMATVYNSYQLLAQRDLWLQTSHFLPFGLSLPEFSYVVVEWTLWFLSKSLTRARMPGVDAEISCRTKDKKQGRHYWGAGLSPEQSRRRVGSYFRSPLPLQQPSSHLLW